MTNDQFLALYDQQLRAEAEVADADELTIIGPLLAATFPGRGRGFITYRHIPASADLDALVSAAVNHYTADVRVNHFEWKTRGHDDLPHLDDVLRRYGFVFEDYETVMVGSVEAVMTAASDIPTGYTVEQATTSAAIREAEALAGRVFGKSPASSARRADEFVTRFERDPGTFEVWLVRDPTGEVVCSGRVDFVATTDFAGLWGGVCDTRHRGRGLYRCITAKRAQSAQAKGYCYLQSDCTEFSRPILERAGLTPITTTTPAVWKRR
ncbi:hypothetical protein HMPREF1531_01489 [Propionibacterium sp. oral taxon 192 str. F0372]|uniref:hypothetical protein n=1 Tax=Propionibacterium sp. oral taxon 192 TaxID=671222 RepID=UPI00035468AB|nr:hypothetical protein [Propionibacterium sp. oral taxon 192]EPH03428.1 hypothetical protein HMPREF1531_01489 [Propionibacterium sp. oral taxon 192 str. F0372]